MENHFGTEGVPISECGKILKVHSLMLRIGANQNILDLRLGSIIHLGTWHLALFNDSHVPCTNYKHTLIFLKSYNIE